MRFANKAILTALVSMALLSAGCGLHKSAGSPRPASLIFWVTDLAALSGGKTTEAFDINAAGQVVGRSDFSESNWHSHAVLWTSGKPTDLGTLDGGGSEATRISDRGDAGGWSSSKALNIHAVHFQNSRILDLGTSQGTTSTVSGIDNNGQLVINADTSDGASRSYVVGLGGEGDIGFLPGYRNTISADFNNNEVVGTANDSQKSFRAFVWKLGRITPLPPPPGDTNSFAYGVNRKDEIVGGASIGLGPSHAVMWVQNLPTLLPGLSKFESMANAVNDNGDVVGRFKGEACEWQNGKLIILNRVIGPHATSFLSDAVAINNQGQIVCNGIVNNHKHAFLLTPAV